MNFQDPPQRPRRQLQEEFAEVFGVPVSELEEAAVCTGREAFTPEPTFDTLTPLQRNTVIEIIRLPAAGNHGVLRDTDDMNPEAARTREDTTTRTTPRNSVLPASFAADFGEPAGVRSREHAQHLGAETQDGGDCPSADRGGDK